MRYLLPTQQNIVLILHKYYIKFKLIILSKIIKCVTLKLLLLCDYALLI